MILNGPICDGTGTTAHLGEHELVLRISNIQRGEVPDTLDTLQVDYILYSNPEWEEEKDGRVIKIGETWTLDSLESQSEIQSTGKPYQNVTFSPGWKLSSDFVKTTTPGANMTVMFNGAYSFTFPILKVDDY
jgi:hypothetical protein